MKKLLAVAMLLASSMSYADEWLEASNKAGGRILLFKAECTELKGWRVMLSTLPNSKSIRGCWSYLAKEVQVRYDDGELYSYPSSIFKLASDVEESKSK